MAKAWNNLIGSLVLYSGAALTADTNGTEKTDARLADFRSGILVLVHDTVDVASADEKYDFYLEGRMNSTDAYTTLASQLNAAATALAGTIQVISVPLFMKRMRIRLDVTGTTPSWKGTAIAFALEKMYAPDLGTIVTA